MLSDNFTTGWSHPIGIYLVYEFCWMAVTAIATTTKLNAKKIAEIYIKDNRMAQQKKKFFLKRWLVFISFSTCFVVSPVIMCVLFLIFCRFFHSTVQLLVQLVKLCVINCICLLWLNSCDFVAKRESFFLSYTELYLWLVLWVIYSVLRHPPSP